MNISTSFASRPSSFAPEPDVAPAHDSGAPTIRADQYGDDDVLVPTFVEHPYLPDDGPDGTLPLTGKQGAPPPDVADPGDDILPYGGGHAPSAPASAPASAQAPLNPVRTSTTPGAPSAPTTVTPSFTAPTPPSTTPSFTAPTPPHFQGHPVPKQQGLLGNIVQHLAQHPGQHPTPPSTTQKIANAAKAIAHLFHF